MTDSISDQPLDRFHELLTRALDSQLTPAEQAEFTQLLAASPANQNEWEEFSKLKAMTVQMKYPTPPNEVWGRYWADIYNRLERRLAWVLVSIGAMILLFYGGYLAVDSILEDTKTPWAIKAGILALLAGTVILFVSVLREKLFTYKTDQYKDITR